MGNDGDGTHLSFKLRDSEADAFDANGTFVDGVLLHLARQFNTQPEIFGAGDAIEGNERADAVHVALDDVPAEAAVGLHGQFQIDSRALVNAGERGALPGLWCEIGAERFRLDVERGEADAAD